MGWLPPHTAIIDGRRLRQLRRQAGLSIDNLAHQAGSARLAAEAARLAANATTALSRLRLAGGTP